MLVLRRKVGERILLGERIWITVLAVEGDRVKLGIDAPTDVVVLREEVAARDASLPIYAPLVREVRP